MSAKALVIHDGKILVIRKRDENGDYFLLPGGGQEHGEPLTEVVRREVLEETGLRVEAEDLAFVRDYIGANHEFAATSSHFHQVELYFWARLADGSPSRDVVPAHPDVGQTGVDWIPLEAVETLRVYPLSLRAEIARQSFEKIYRGDVN